MKGLQERDEQGVLFAPQMGESRDGQTPHRWDNTCAPACTANIPPGSPPFAPSFRTWGEQRGPTPESTGSLCPCVSPHLGFLERSEVRGRALEPLLPQGQAPGSGDQSPLAVVT